MRYRVYEQDLDYQGYLIGSNVMIADNISYSHAKDLVAMNPDKRYMVQIAGSK